MSGKSWELGFVTLPAGRRASALRHPETGEVFRDRGLYVPVPGARPVGAATAATFSTRYDTDPTEGGSASGGSPDTEAS